MSRLPTSRAEALQPARAATLTVPAEFAKGKKTFTIPLTTGAIEVIERWQGKHAEFVFVRLLKDVGNKPIKTQLSYANWRVACKTAGVPGARFHDLRHTWATRMLMVGAPQKVVQELGAWSTIDMVNHYQKVLPDFMREWAEKGAAEIAAGMNVPSEEQ